MRHRACGFGDDRRVAGVSPGFASVQIGDAAHGQSRQIGDEYAFGTSDRHWKRADGGRLPFGFAQLVAGLGPRCRAAAIGAHRLAITNPALERAHAQAQLFACLLQAATRLRRLADQRYT